MAKGDNHQAAPRVPDGPTLPMEMPAPPAEPPHAAASRPERMGPAPAGGNDPSPDAVAERIAELVAALAPFTRIPWQPGRAPETVEYVLTRGPRSATITAGDIVRARAALGLPI